MIGLHCQQAAADGGTIRLRAAVVLSLYVHTIAAAAAAAALAR